MVRVSHIASIMREQKGVTVPAGDFGLCVDAMPDKLRDCGNRYRGYLQTALSLWGKGTGRRTMPTGCVCVCVCVVHVKRHNVEGLRF